MRHLNAGLAIGILILLTASLRAGPPVSKWVEPEENPPLSAKKVLKLANKTKDSFSKGVEKDNWNLESCDLIPCSDDNWCWTVNYSDQTAYRGWPRHHRTAMRFGVLMDGKVIKSGPIIILPLMRTNRPTDTERTYCSSAFGKQYVVTITKMTWMKTPKWVQAEENPLLSARKAIKAASKMKDSLVKSSKEYRWYLDSCSLVPAGDDRWYWTVKYAPLFQAFSSAGHRNSLTLIIAMDGTVITPEVSDCK
jgi:hypothetical protein